MALRLELCNKGYTEDIKRFREMQCSIGINDKLILQGGTTVAENGKSNYVYIWRIFEFCPLEKHHYEYISDTSIYINCYLYVAFCKSDTPYFMPTKEGKVHKNWRVNQETNDLVWRIFRKGLHTCQGSDYWKSTSISAGYELYEGDFYAEINNPPAGVPQYIPLRLKEYLPGYCEEDVIFSVIRTDNIWLRHTYPQGYERMEEVKERESKKLRKPDYDWKLYGSSLKNIVNDWVDDRLIATDFTEFLKRKAFEMPGVTCDMFDRMGVVNVCKKKDFMLTHCFPTWFVAGKYGIHEEFEDENGVRSLNYMTDNAVGKWLINRLKGKSNEDLEKKMVFRVDGSRVHYDVDFFLHTKKVKFDGMDDKDLFTTMLCKDSGLYRNLISLSVCKSAQRILGVIC